MSRSLNEIEAMALKAARGAGLPWGMAQEAGRAVRWLQSHGLPGVEALAQMLPGEAGAAPADLGGHWQGRLCPLLCGASLCDTAARFARGEGVVMERVLHPLLLLPFAAMAGAQVGRIVVVEWEGAKAACCGARLAVTGPQVYEAGPVMLRCYAVQEAADSRAPGFRGDVEPQAWRMLEGLAARTYAPESAESRRLGAGAGDE
ncbi:DUF3726 domain-containing protein [Alphaproteobacteria bacterium KMM 3653]|uniref:DUF3726 domain-containing protein n=1 Tax=Harenicola maris TaxID=2841044 RepID=A0AAP2CSL0_9RHOB|nr:DUF3726 domain-containing protein [Harenicola maris]